MGEVRLPGLIGLHRFKAGDVCLRALRRGEGYESGSAKDAPDSRERWDMQLCFT